MNEIEFRTGKPHIVQIAIQRWALFDSKGVSVVGVADVLTDKEKLRPIDVEISHEGRSFRFSEGMLKLVEMKQPMESVQAAKDLEASDN